MKQGSTELEGKVALVTGAGSGIGKATAVLLARQGAVVGTLGHTEDEIRETVNEIKADGGKAVPLIADVADARAMERAVGDLTGQCGRLDIVFANAGINGVWAPIDEIQPDEWDRTINTNLRGAYLTIHHAVPHLKKAGGGAIVVTSSINGTRVFSNAGTTAYSCTKAAQLAMVQMLAVEEPDAREVVQLIQAEGRKAVAIPGDIQDEAFCTQLVSRAADELGGLDILVNNAAKQAAQASIADITTEQFDATFKTNVYAMFWITKAALPHLSEGATIINTASIQAYEPSAILLDYAQTKACIVAFTKSLSKQLVQKGIRVNAVAPGPFWTPLQPSGGQMPDKLKTFGADGPFGRPGQPAELAHTYVLLASQESSFVTGEVYGVTGGNPTP